MWTVFLWLNMPTSDSLLWKRYWNTALSKKKWNVLTELRSSELLKNVRFMQLVTPSPNSTVSNSLHWGDIILSLLITRCFCWINVKQDVHFEEIGGGKILFRRIFTFDWQEVKSIGLAENEDNLWALVNTAMKVCFHKGGGVIFWLYDKVSFLKTLF